MKVRELISLLLEKPQDDEVTAEVIVRHYIDDYSAGTVASVMDAPVTDVLPGSWPVQLKCCVNVKIVSKVEVW